MAVLVKDTFITKVRNFMRDKPELNRLLHTIESENISIELAMELTADEWNITPPYITTITFGVSGTVDIINIPSRADYVLFYGTVTHLMESVLMLRSRNKLTYTDGGVTVADEEGPWQAYTSLLPMFQQRYRMAITRLKTLENIGTMMDGYGGVGSDYSLLSYWGVF